MLNKITTYFLILILLINSIGGVFAFYGLKSYFKSEFKKYKKSNETDLLKEILVFKTSELKTKLRFEHDKEFHYNNELYDIISQKVSKDSIEYLVLKDTKEKQMYGAFFSYLEKNINDKTNNIKKILNSVFTGFVYYVSNKLSYEIFFKYLLLNNVNLISNYSSIYLDLPSPPPRF